MRKVLPALMLCVFCREVLSSTCDPVDIEKKIVEADYIFTATVIDRVKVADKFLSAEEHVLCGSKVATLEVKDLFKGERRSQFKVESIDACSFGGPDFVLGEHYLVFANAKEEGGDVLEDMGACYTDPLGYGVEQLVFLNKAFGLNANYLDKKIVGAWESFNHSDDAGYERIEIYLGSSYGFYALTTNKKNFENYYCGSHYVFDDSVVFYDEDGFQPYSYELKGDDLVITSGDNKYRYTLRRGNFWSSIFYKLLDVSGLADCEY